MPLTVPTPITPLPTPASTINPDNFDTLMDAYFVAEQAMVPELNAQNLVAYGNASLALTAAALAADAVAGASAGAGAAADSAADAVAAKNVAVAAAQAAQSSAGLPVLVANTYLGVNAAGVMGWILKTAETFWAKAVGGKVQGLGYTFVDKGTVAAGGTAAFLFSDGDTQRVQAAGALTITAGGWQPAGVRCEMELQCVNFGGKTVTWPAGWRWIIAGGGYTTVASSNGVTFQTSGTDYVLVWTDDAGAIPYAKVLR